MAQMVKNVPANAGDLASIPGSGRHIFHDRSSEIRTVVVQVLSRVRLFATPWTVACQALLSMGGFSRQEHGSGLTCPPPGDLPNPGIEPRSPALQADSLLSEPPGRPKKG